jgi:hypothetical protein
MTATYMDDLGFDEAALAAALLDLLDRDEQAVPGIVASLPRLTTPAGTIINVIREAVASGQTPTRVDVWNESQVDDPVGEIRAALVEAMGDKVATGRRSADVARRAAGRIVARHHEVALADALAAAAAAPGDADRWADAVAARARLEAGSTSRGKLLTAMDAIDRWAKNETTPVVPTGFAWLDRATDGGLPVGGLTALVAPPGVGKSALALQWAVGAMLADADLRVVWAAGEMPLFGIGRRLVTAGSGLVEGCSPIGMTEAGEVTPHARAAGRRVAEAIGDRLVFVEPPITVAAIDAAVVETRARLVVVDYLQLVAVPDGGRDRTADLDRTVGQIRDMAIRREAAIVVVSSLAKATAAAAHAGQLGRGTAEIGFAAELVYSGEREETADGRPVVGPDGTVNVTWRCAKARNGEPRDLRLRFDGAAQTYADDGQEITYFPTVPPGALGIVTLDTWTPPEAVQ